MSIPMDSVGAAEVRCAPPPRIEYILTARELRFTRALLWQALKKALANGPAAPGAYDNKGGFDSYAQHAQATATRGSSSLAMCVQQADGSGPREVDWLVRSVAVCKLANGGL